MKREIKFRAWDNTQKTMVNQDTCFPFTLLTQYGLFRLDPCQVEDNYQKINREPVLMQFTGLKDKNGKEIYEGDWVKDNVGRNWEVRYNSNIGCFTFHWDKDDKQCQTFRRFNEHQRPLEIIGNIYETPELLTN